jgi:hypothetical protein
MNKVFKIKNERKKSLPEAKTNVRKSKFVQESMENSEFIKSINILNMKEQSGKQFPAKSRVSQSLTLTALIKSKETAIVHPQYYISKNKSQFSEEERPFLRRQIEDLPYLSPTLRAPRKNSCSISKSAKYKKLKMSILNSNSFEFQGKNSRQRCIPDFEEKSQSGSTRIIQVGLQFLCRNHP